MPPRTVSRHGLAAVVAALAIALPATVASAASAPGAPGQRTTWASADKDGFGTAFGRTSRVWFTLSHGALTEVYYPRLDQPSVRDLELVVGDGHGGAERETDATRSVVQRVAGDGLTFRQVDTARSGRYRVTKTYVTDPARAVVLANVRVESLTGRPLQVWVRYDPALRNDGDHDRGRTAGSTLLARGGGIASALATSPALSGRASSSGYRGTRSDPWRDVRANGRLDRRYTAASRSGNVVQLARLPLTGLRGAQRLTMALAFARTEARAQSFASAALRAGFAPISRSYAEGWAAYMASLKAPPASVASDPALRAEYDTSLMVMRASEDKTFRGASIASPTMPWHWGDHSIEKGPSAAYHLVWSRDLYQVATAQLAAGDVGSASRELDYLLFTQQKADGSVPQNSFVDGREKWTSTQMDEVAFPIVLAWQLGRSDARTYARVKRAAEYIVRHGPHTKQERWENQSGWSPGTIAAEIAGLVCAADLASRAGDTAAAARYSAVADSWASAVQAWTATSNGPYTPRPYYLRLTKDRAPDRATKYGTGDSGPSKADQRAVVDPSFLELVRLGIKRFDDPVIVNTVSVVDKVLGVQTPNGPFWHRFTFDGYGETRAGDPWGIGKPDTFKTFGRAWPVFAGERGEYELASGRPAGVYLRAIAAAANSGGMIPEQVWDGRAPTGASSRFAPGEPTFSATPLAWSHAVFVRLAWSIDAGRPVERPSVVACRYAAVCG
jgi:glucoamylase